MNAIWASYFGYPYGSVWSNLIASGICALIVWWRVRARMVAHHAEQLAQAARHHAEQLAQAERHHAESKILTDRRHEAMVSHVSAVGAHVASASVAVPQQLLDDIAKAPRKPGKGGA